MRIKNKMKLKTNTTKINNMISSWKTNKVNTILLVMEEIYLTDFLEILKFRRFKRKSKCLNLQQLMSTLRNLPK